MALPQAFLGTFRISSPSLSHQPPRQAPSRSYTSSPAQSHPNPPHAPAPGALTASRALTCPPPSSCGRRNQHRLSLLACQNLCNIRSLGIKPSQLRPRPSHLCVDPAACVRPAFQPLTTGTLAQESFIADGLAFTRRPAEVNTLHPGYRLAARVARPSCSRLRVSTRKEEHVLPGLGRSRTGPGVAAPRRRCARRRSPSSISFVRHPSLDDNSSISVAAGSCCTAMDPCSESSHVSPVQRPRRRPPAAAITASLHPPELPAHLLKRRRSSISYCPQQHCRTLSSILVRISPRSSASRSCL